MPFALLCLGCGSTIITPQPGYEWCVEVQSPDGSESDPDNLGVDIVDSDGMDPKGCRCFSGAENEILTIGAEADGLGDPLPAGYEAFRDQLVSTARQRCTEIALDDHDPPLMYTDCLTKEVSLPYPTPGPSSNCTICVKDQVWGGGSEIVDCPGSLGGGTGGVTPTTTSGGDGTADETTAGNSSLDDSSTGNMFDCNAWDPGAEIASRYYSSSSGNPEGWYHTVHTGLLETIIDEHFIPLLSCDDGRYVEQSNGVWAFQTISTGDLLWILGLRDGYEDVKIRGYDPVSATGRTPWYGFESVADSIAAFDALYSHSTFNISVVDSTGSTSVERHIFVDVVDCNTPNGFSCPTP